MCWHFVVKSGPTPIDMYVKGWRRNSKGPHFNCAKEGLHPGLVTRSSWVHKKKTKKQRHLFSPASAHSGEALSSTGMHSVRDLFTLFTQTCEAQWCDRTQCVSLSWAHWQMQHSSCDSCQLLVCIMNLVKQGITEGTPACHNSTQSENGLFSFHDGEPQQQHFMIFWTVFWPSQKLWRSTGNATLFLQGNYHLLYQICTLFAKATARTVAFATVLGTF